jgi:hypothetical protein
MLPYCGPTMYRMQFMLAFGLLQKKVLFWGAKLHVPCDFTDVCAGWRNQNQAR